jgi:prepilin-type N-terminal cleavage/methylation domain-containing protein/prepilin-type processing-associated H-X9-DG protein
MHPKQLAGRGGFTLIELLVVIAIIAVLIGLLLPAVQSAREAARRGQCSNNLKQIGVALHNYHQSYGTFPLGTTVAIPGGTGGMNESPVNTWSAQSLMLPYLEQQPLYDAANFWLTNNSGLGIFVNSTVFNTNLAIFICPSDGLSPTVASWASSNCNYMGSIGTTTFSGQQDATGIFNPGTFGPTGYAKPPAIPVAVASSITSVTDGTAYTVAFSESLVGDQTHFTKWRDGVSWTSSAPYFYQVADAWSNASLILQALSACNQKWSTSADQPSAEDKGWRWASSWMGYSLFNTIVPPSAQAYPWSACRTDNSQGPVSNGEFENATSNHPGGCNVLFCDGGVRFIKSSVAINTWWSLGTKSVGEAIDGTSY